MINAIWDDFTCVCHEDWSGPDCSQYNGPCHPKCNGCLGPSEMDCVSCIPNATELALTHTYGACVCDFSDMGGWYGEKCELWEGFCSDACEDCDQGPDPELCTKCTDHAFRNEYGLCECHSDWTGERCDTYIGECDKKCLSCSGPTAFDCV